MHIDTEKRAKLFPKVFGSALLLCVLCSFIYWIYTTYTTVFANEEVQSIHILPGTVQSSDWFDTNALYIRDVSEDATFDRFNAGNSAHIHEIKETAPTSAQPKTETVTPKTEENDATSTEEIALPGEESSVEGTTSPEMLPDKSEATGNKDATSTETIVATTTDAFATTSTATTTSEEKGTPGTSETNAADTATSTEDTSNNPLPSNGSTSTATSTISRLWGVIKNALSTYVLAQVASTSATSSGETVEAPDSATSSLITAVEENSTTTSASSSPPKSTSTEEEIVKETTSLPVPSSVPSVEDTIPPQIEILGNNPAYIELGADYNDLGAFITNTDDENLGIEVLVDGVAVRSVVIDTSEDGVHYITYSATDNAGNTGTAKRAVVVGAAEFDESLLSTEEPTLIGQFTGPTSFCDDTDTTCTKKTIEFSDFNIPEFLDEQSIQNAQLRFSLGGRPNTNANSSEGIVIEYYYQGEWYVNGSIALTDEVSNAINGGYFLYSLPIFNSFSELDGFKVRLTYESDSADVGNVYLDALWLEVETSGAADTLPEEEVKVKKVEPGALEEKKFDLELLSGKSSYQGDELPNFRFRYRERQGLIRSVITDLLELISDPYSDIELTATVAGVDSDVAVRYQQNGEFAIDFLKKPRHLKPGKNILTITIKDGDKVYVGDYEFLWGVLAINTDKTIYLPEEDAYIQMGVVDEEGHTVCDANLELQISRNGVPLTVLSTAQGTILYSDACIGDTFVTVPDYTAHYPIPDETGKYELKLTATTPEGTNTTTDIFEVRNEVPYDIERTGPTRIYPLKTYPVTLTVTANEDFEGIVEETVPGGFTLLPLESTAVFDEVVEGEDETLVRWHVALEAGQSKMLGYQFDAPDISPAFYLSGPLRMIGNDGSLFEEIRQWQIAADAVTFVNSGGVAGTSFTFNIGTAGTDRLVVVMADDESTGVNLTGATVDGNACNLVVIADNTNGLGNHQEMWYCDEDDLGASNGNVTVAVTGGDAGWGLHAHLYTNVSQSGPTATGTDTTSAGINTATVTGINVPANGLVVAGWAEGTDALTETAQTSPLVTRQTGPDPASADFFTSSGIESSAQTNKTYQFTFSGNHNRASGIVAVWPWVADVFVDTSGNQTDFLSIDSQDNYIGGVFTFTETLDTSTITDVTIEETGTIDAQNDLSNVRLYYENDTSDPYDCLSESYDGVEAQFGATTSFDGASTAAFSDSVGVSTTSTMCLYTVLDVDPTASADETIEIQITNPSTDVVLASGGIRPTTTVAIATTTILVANQPPTTPMLEETPLFPNNLATTTLPLFGEFSSTDGDGDLIEYELSIDDDYFFGSPATTTFSSNFPGDAGWASTTFASGATTTYQLQSGDALTNGVTYWWRVRARDPAGSDTWSDYSELRSVTINTTNEFQQWHQTTGFQFETDTLSNIATTTGAVELAGSGNVTILDGWTTGSTKTISSGSNRLLVVGIHSEDSTTNTNVNTVTYGGVQLTEIDDEQVGGGFSNGMWMGYLDEAGIQNAVGTTITPSWVGGTPDEAVLYSSVVLESVNQSAPVRAWSGGTNTNASTVQPTTTVSVLNGDMALYVTVSGATGETHTAATNYTEGTEEDSGGAGEVASNAYRAITADGTEQPIATWTGTNNRLGIVAASFAPVTTGTIMSTEADFDWVPNDNDWGQVEWNVTEVEDNSSLLHVYYTNATACDTIVPDGDLAGNSSGFSTSSIPLNISGLSTTTYNRICLQMELDRGSTTTSPTLNDWTVRWDLAPVFTQNYYHWYANENAEPPTDTWPLGSGETELNENEPITTADPVGDGDVLRLRMSVLTTNTEATAGDADFTLQYAEGDTCSASLEWFDVGAIGSTTALWRGYDNSGVSDGATLSSTTLSVTDVLASYEEENDSALIPNTISVGEDAEWDWVVQDNNAAAGTSYCFRMIKSNDALLTSYNNYPRLVTNSAPNAPTLDTLFDNEKTASTSPRFTFYATDNESEDLHYQIQIDDNFDFSSTLVDANSEDNNSFFENLDVPSDKEPYTQNQLIRFTSTTTLSDNVTYWWRVRARDPNGSNQWGDWSSLRSFTVDTSVSVSTWFQTTEKQFDTDTLLGTDALVTDEVSLLAGSTTGTTTSSAIDFDWATIGNAWGSLSWNDTETTGDILYRLEYYNGSSWALIPDSDLSGNTAGFDSSPVSLTDLDTVTYNLIRIRADFTNIGGSPTLQDWTLSWGQRVAVPTHLLPFDNEKFSTTTPEFTFYSTDPQGDDLEYEISWSTDNTFTSSTTKNSSVDPGFENIASSIDTDPFTSGDTVRFSIQPSDALSASTTYWWRTRAKDPLGSDSWSFWSGAESFTTATSGETINVSTWFQDTQEQFDTDTLSGVSASTSDSVGIAQTGNIISSIEHVTGTTGATSPTTVNLTGGTELDKMFHICSFSFDVADNLHDQTFKSTELTATDTLTIFHGTATGNQSLTYDCEVISFTAASDITVQRFLTPTTNSDTANNQTISQVSSVNQTFIVPHGETDDNDTTIGSEEIWEYQLTSDTNVAVFVDSGNNSAHPGVRFEVVDWNNSDITVQHVNNNTMTTGETTDTIDITQVDLSKAWILGSMTTNGVAAGSSPTDDFGMRVDFLDNDTIQLRKANAGVQIEWSAQVIEDTSTRGIWNVQSGTIALGTGETSDTLTISSVDTSNTFVAGTTFNTFGFTGESSDTSTGNVDTSIATVALTNGTTITATRGVTDSTTLDIPVQSVEFIESTTGTAVSTPIDFDDGDGPGWGAFSWNDSTPGASSLLYQVEYFTSTSSWALVPDSFITGNSSGLSTSPVDLSALDYNLHNQIRLVGNFNCGLPNCPTLYDWTVTWAPGITISGTAQTYDQSTNLTSGTVAVAVNDELQRFKTGTISGGVWSIPFVTVFPGDTVTVFIDGAGDSGEAVGVTKYDGSGDITGMELYERHLSIGSDDNATTTNAELAQFDLSSSGDEDVFFDVDAGNDLSATSTGTFNDVELYVVSGSQYIPDPASSGNVATHDVEINGEIIANGNTISLSGSWDNNGAFTANTGSVVFTATSTTETIDSTGAATSTFNNVTLGQTSGTATWELASYLDVNGNLTIDQGTLFASTSSTTLAGNLTINANGLYAKGTATTTFDGSVARTWTDNTTSKQDLGIVVIDGTSKTLNLGSDVALTDLTIGANDTLNVTTGNHDIEVFGNWTNNNLFTAQQGAVIFGATTTGFVINPGNSNFFDLTFRGTGGAWAFTTSNVTINNNLTVASGTPTLAVGTTTINDSLITTDTFVHNNGTVLFNSTGAETIMASTSSFYNLVFNGSGGSWTMQDTNATSSHNVIVQNGTVTFPSGTFAVGNALEDSGGAITANNGTVRMYATDAGNTLTFDGSLLANLTFDGSGGTFSVTDTNATTTGSMNILAGSVTLPSGTFAIGGSFINNDIFTHNNSTVRMTAPTTGFTVSAGNSLFYNLIFDSTTGGWALSGNATTTNNLSLLHADTFSADGFVEVQNIFTNAVGGASTTWSGSTLFLNSGTDYGINTKTLGGDAYNTLSIGTNTDIDMWNSTSTTYIVDGSGSLYSQDHNGTDGDLYIFGDYVRSSGNDYWSYATDFDGTDLSGGSERQTNVLFANNATGTFLGGTLQILGTTSASTTINNQGTGDYSVVIGDGTLNAQYYAFRNLDANGLTLAGSSTVTSLADGDFELAQNGASLITIGTNAINSNPAFQIQRVRFATTTAITGFNVTATGTPTSYWWFRNHYGNLDGEDFDNDSGNPGEIRWDDSAFSINVSGHVYADEGSTAIGDPPCDGSSPVVRVRVNGGGDHTGSCDPGTGAYTVSNVTYNGDPVLTVYLDTDGGARAVAVTKTPSEDIADMDLYENRVIVRHEDVSPLTIADMAIYDALDDSDVIFTAATGSPDTLALEPNTGLFIWHGKSFTPGGNMTLNSGGSGDIQDGTLKAGTSTTLTFTGTESHSIGGSFIMDATTVFDAANATLTFTATTSGKTLAATSTLDTLVFNGSGGEWTIASSTTVSGDISMTAGTILGTADIFIQGGDITGDGIVNLSGGTVTLEGTGSIGGNSNWTFGNVSLGDGATIATTTKLGTGSIESSGVLTINGQHTLDAGSSNWELSGNGTPFVIDGTFNASTTLFSYTATGATNIATTTYNDLTLAASGGSPVYTIQSGVFTVNNAFTVGDGTNAVTVTADTNDPAITVNGTTTIQQNGIFTGSSANTYTAGGSWDNQGTFNHANGTVLFSTSTTGHTIAASTSPFFTVDVNNASGGWTFTESATATNNFNLNNANAFTVSPGVTLEVDGQFSNGVGGGNTTWTDSTLYLNSGTNYPLNTKATGGDAYGTLAVGLNTDISMWNSTSTIYAVDSSGSLYSQDHNAADGDLYIWGDYGRSLGNEYWSYATDFDGTDLSGGFERRADVFLADNATTTLSGGSLTILGSATASTTIQNQGSGTYALDVTGGTFSAQYYVVRDINENGLNISGTPTVNQLSNGDFLLEINGGTTMTVAGGSINANPGKTFTANIFATSTGITGFNVTATGVSVNAWRFTGYSGNLAGEAFDSDPGGDPGYIIWDNSDTQVTISGNVYSDEGVTAIGNPPCDGSSQNVRLLVQGGSATTTACDAGTGAYTFPGILFNPGDSIIVYLDTNGGARAANVTVDPATSISNMDLYENHVIVRHEDINPLTIDDMAVYDSSDDSDIPFTAVSGSPDTLVLPPNTGLFIWESKTFAPGGNVTLNSGGSGEAQDGTLRGGPSSTFTAAGTESHSIGGSLDLDAGSTFVSANATFTFTATTSGKIITATSSPFYNIVFNGSGGAWSFPPGVVESSNDFTISAGNVTLPTGTTTVGGSFDNTGGSFSHNNGTLYLTSTASGETVEAGGSAFYNLTFDGSGGEWTFADTNATTSNNFIITTGSTTLPTGTTTIGASFENQGGTFTALTGSTQSFTSTGSDILYANGSDFGSLTFNGGGGSWTFIDEDATSTGDVVISAGTLTLATGTMAVAESFDNQGGSFTSGATTTVYLYGSGPGETIRANGSLFTDLVIDGNLGVWTVVGDATTTGIFSLLNADTFSASGFIESQGEFTNLVGGASTTWTGSTLYIRSGTNYSVNTKSAGGDAYETLIVGQSSTSTDIRLWNSTSTIYTTQGTSSIYSQDHNGTDGNLYIWGDYERSSGTDYWSYATDFDGTDLSGGSERQVNVLFDSSATTTISGGTLNIVGSVGATTTVANQGSGVYGLHVTDGTFNAQYYAFRNLSGEGLYLYGTSTTVSSLSNGDFELGVEGGSMVTVASTTIDNNPTLVINNTRFATSSGITSGFNMSRDATSTNAWTFNSHYGNYDGEAFDNDGFDDCGSFRWDDSSCLFVSQEHYRWRNDDGGEGAPASEWYDQSFTRRQKITLTDTAATTSTNLQVNLFVPYDADMQADFDDLRFTDSSGTTTIDYWIEETVTSASSSVWVEVPTLSANGSTDIYMYYGSSTAPDASSGSATFRAFDNFEDNDISEYSGDTGLFETGTGFNYNGTYGLNAAAGQVTSQTTDGIYRTDADGTASAGSIIRYFEYVDMSAGADDEPCTLFAVQTPGSNNNNYAVCLDPFNTDQIVIARDVSSNDGSGTTLASKDVTFTTGWYEVLIGWQTDGTIDVSVYDDGIFFASTTANDTTYTSGGMGFSFWAQHGGWDFYTARTYISSDPTAVFDVEQDDSGATWKTAEDTLLTGQNIQENVRLRFSVNNTGAQITDQNFRLQAAPKGGFGQCESVPTGNFVDIPPDSSCGAGNFACMATSSGFTDLASTTPHLSKPSGSTFTYGQIVEDPSNETGNIDVDQNEYTEVEYAFQFTANATSSAYCLRTTDNGTALDNYENVAEVRILQAPILTNFTLNSALDITLTPGSTTTVYATGTVIDLNGYADLDYATTTIYRSGVGAQCSLDENSCYQVASTSCSFSNCAGNSCELSCGADIQYFADPTDSGTYSGEEWLADIFVVDSTGESDLQTTLGVDMLTLRALTSSSSIPYGTLAVNTDTGSYNATTTITNDGNDNIDISLSGTDLTFGPSSIGVNNQLYATSSFIYSSCGTPPCTALSSTPASLEVDLIKPTSSTTLVTDEVYWGLFVPIGTAAATHEGTNTFTAVGD